MPGTHTQHPTATPCHKIQRTKSDLKKKPAFQRASSLAVKCCCYYQRTTCDGSQVYKMTWLKRQVSAFLPTLFWVLQYNNCIFINLHCALLLLTLWPSEPPTLQQGSPLGAASCPLTSGQKQSKTVCVRHLSTTPPPVTVLFFPGPNTHVVPVHLCSIWRNALQTGGIPSVLRIVLYVWM